MADHRIIVNGVPVNFSCDNRGFRTNTRKGYAHRPHANTRGSVIKTAVIDHGDYSLWLEHVAEKGGGRELYWLMWYNGQGVPLIPASGVFGKSDLATMHARLTEFVP